MSPSTNPADTSRATAAAVRELSVEELNDVSGGFIPWIIFGAVMLGAGLYAGYNGAKAW